jgi:hypothetical protein
VAAVAAALAAVGSLSSGDGRPTIRLWGPTATATVQLKPTVSGTRVRLRATGLAPTRSDEVYEVWVIRDGKRISAGTFSVGPSGKIDVELTTAARVGDRDQIDITHQPDVREPERPGRSVLDGIVRH